MYKKILVGSIIVLFSLLTISYGAGPVAIVTDSKGSIFELSDISHSWIDLVIGTISAKIDLNQIASMALINKEEAVWRILPIEGPPLDANVSGKISGEWIFGNYQAEFKNLSQLSFPGRTPARAWPEKMTHVAQFTLLGDIDLRVVEVHANPIKKSYASYAPGAVQYIDQGPFIALSYGGATLLMDLQMVKKVVPEGDASKIILKDGTEYVGRLSDEYSFNATTSWGSVTIPHSVIKEAKIIMTEAIGAGIKEKKALEIMFSNASFPGQIEVEDGKTIGVTGFVLEYAEHYSGCNSMWRPCMTYSDTRFFAATENIPFYLGENFIQLEYSKIKNIIVAGNDGGIPRFQVTAKGGSSIHGEFPYSGKDDEGLWKYSKSGDRRTYSLQGILGQCNFGYIRIPVSALKEIRRTQN